MPIIPSTKRLNASAVDILNAIRNSASANYRDYIPAADASADSVKEIGRIIMDFPALKNEFLTALVNRIGRVLITSKMYENPWAVFKRGTLEFGETVEEIFVNIAKPFEFDPAVAESKIFAREIPDVRAAFHILNYQVFYKATIQNEQLRQAFLSWDGISTLIAKIVEAMYTGAAYDEFVTMKYMLAKHILNGELYPKQVSTVSAANMKAIAATVKGVSNRMEFLSTDYNLSGVANRTEKRDQYLIMNADFDATMDVEVLASAFNMDKAEFMGHRILIDGFGVLDAARLAELFKGDPNYTALTDAEKTALNAIPAVLVDRDWFMIFDNLFEFTEQYNGEGLYWNYWYHTWKTFSVSPFANACVFVPGLPSITSVEVSPSSITISPGQRALLSAEVTTDNFASKAVNWSLVGTLAFPSIAVDGSGEAIAATSTSIPFDGAEVSANALAGRKIVFGTGTDKYTIVSNTTSALTITPGLASNVADNTTINAADTVTGDDLPAYIDIYGEITIAPDCPSGTSITATATSVYDSTKSDTCAVTVG
ncbi:MAG: hypothetical protein J6Q48_05875 [Bacteroidaceae bacterium]|nr:hypothetical protein [Bacteroidaceae bacterium]